MILYIKLIYSIEEGDRVKGIVLFYSLSGQTKRAAEEISTRLNLDLLEIETVRHMPKNRLLSVFIGGAMAQFGLCPSIKASSISLEQYDYIILGTPVWAGKCAAPVKSFIKKYGIDKTIAIFTSSGSGENEKCIEELKSVLPFIKAQVSLVDKSQPDAKDNSKKLERFIKDIQTSIEHMK